MPTQTRSRVSVHIRVNESLDIEISKLVAELKRKGIDKTDIYELGARIVLVITKARRIPDDLGEVLGKLDPEALDLLVKLIERVKEVER